jgi:WD40 repeat protein
MAAASHDKTVRIFDMESRSQVAMVEGQRRPATSLCFFRDGKHLATVALENVVQLWDLESASPLASLWGPASESFAGVALYGGGERVAVALADGRIRLWEPAT